MTRQQRSRGFTLLEVLVAFAILSLTLLVVFRIYSTGFRSIAAADWKLQAVEIAKSKLAGIGIETPLAPGIISGTADGGYAWQLSVSPYVASGAANATSNNLFLVEVAVAPPHVSGDRAQNVKLSSLRLGIAQ